MEHSLVQVMEAEECEVACSHLRTGFGHWANRLDVSKDIFTSLLEAGLEVMREESLTEVYAAGGRGTYPLFTVSG
jgi:hypothetical protein